MDKVIGTIIDNRYKIIELAGVGGMANVYKAVDIEDDKIVALKILKQEFMQNSDFVRRFQNESKAISLLSHTNIVRVFNVSFEKNIKVIVMEYVDGITLKEYIKQQNMLNYKEAVYFTVQILKALQHAHDRGIVHRDVKPHNVMLLKDGTIKVMDFGIARFVRSETVTMSEKTIGSVHYISPEQARGGNVDSKTDIYSMGVMLFEMLTGQLPFEADSPVSVALKQIQDVPEKPRDLNKEIPLGLEEITIRAMQKDKSRRYQSAAEMLKDLDEFRKNPNIRFNYKYEKPASKKHSDESQYDDEIEIQERSPVIAILAGVTTSIVVTVIVFLVYIFVYNNPFESVEEREVPYLIGEKYETIVSSLEKEGFTILPEQAPTSDYGKGFIFEQDPAGGRMVKANSLVIKVKVSNGLGILKMKNYKNQDSDSVLSDLEQMGLKGIVVVEENENMSEGFVISTVPAEGADVVIGSDVTVYVSSGSGNKMKLVPQIIGLNIDEAKKMLINEGLIPGEIETITSDKPVNTVVNSEPAYGSAVEPGTQVDISVSSGPVRSSLSIPVTLTNIPYEMHIEALFGDEISGFNLIASDDLIPVDYPSWTISLSGEGFGTLRITLDGKIYKEYFVDFDSLTFQVITNNEDDFRVAAGAYF